MYYSGNRVFIEHVSIRLFCSVNGIPSTCAGVGYCGVVMVILTGNVQHMQLALLNFCSGIRNVVHLEAYFHCM